MLSVNHTDKIALTYIACQVIIEISFEWSGKVLNRQGLGA